MLFVIENDVADLFGNGNPTPSDVDCLNCLSLAVAEGNHRIGGSRKALNSIATNLSLHRKTRGIFERAACRVAREGNLHLKLTAYGVVTISSENTPVNLSNGSQRVIKYPLSWFDCTAKVQPTVLLGEDLSDGKVLHLMGEAGGVLAKLPHLPLSLWIDHGGGSKTGQVLKTNVEANRHCVCVVDSDRGCPNGALRGTSATVQSFKNRDLYPLVEVAETLGRDLENSLPDNFYENSYGGHSVRGAMSRLLSQLSRCGETDLRFHIDIEKGVTLRKIFGYPPGSVEQIFWTSKMDLLLAKTETTAEKAPCLATGVCANLPSVICSCVILQGNTTNILDDYIDKFKGANRYEIAGCLDDSVRQEWLRLGAMIASWCCADETLRTLQ